MIIIFVHKSFYYLILQNSLNCFRNSYSRILSKKQCFLSNEISKASLWTAVWRDAENRAINNRNKNSFSKPTRLRRYSTGWDGISGPTFTNKEESNNETSKDLSKFTFATLAISTLGYLLSRTASAESVKDEEKEPANMSQADYTLLSTEKTTDDDNKVKASFPNHIPFLLIGGGTASYYAALTIRAKIPDAHCLIVTDEKTTPYNRTPLSRDVWWYGDEKTPQYLSYTTLAGKKRQVPYESNGFFIDPSQMPEFEHGAVSIIKGKKVIKIEPENHKAILDDGTEITYEKCLIGTGSKAKELDVLKGEQFKNHVTTLRGVEDYRTIAKKIEEGKKDFVVIGGGFLGTELSVSLLRNKLQDDDGKLKITQVFRGKGVLRKELPEYMSNYTAMEMKKMGVNIMASRNVTGGEILDNGKIKLKITNDDGSLNEIETDHVIVAIGSVPDITLGKDSGFEVDSDIGGICTDSGMRSTLHPDVFIAGDVSSFYDPIFGRRRIQHWEHAQISGRLAGENMAGGSKTYTHQGSWYTILSPHIHYTGVGRTDSNLPTVSIFAQEVDDEKTDSGDDIQKAVIFYTENKRIVGVVLLNIFSIGVEVARRLIMDRQEIEDFVEISKLFAFYPGPDELEEEEESLKK
ncbi:Putative apoptosis-inducing factor 1, mitochondrial [Strongyloides ratti]|uniref:Putative apoptosis-inducing factor 1, mitochondrial n=1 Tax=Strongyloides ratti TaxID=34506 RepID=A0A090MX87_STRRB|nr:Putative apoptosis-inducing factor 1, mitochondrial [Strongyloides ratti]CEF65004.1 Putative apoptosis-inducing factor 1, mitochondrial [Strongyloides ratti]